MRQTVTVELSIPKLANPRFADLGFKEVDGRTIGGDQGDLSFRGYTLTDDRTVLSSCELIRDNFTGLSQDDINDIAATVLMEAYNSIGVECVEHN